MQYIYFLIVKCCVISDSIQVILTDNILWNEYRSPLILDNLNYVLSYTSQKPKEVQLLESASHLIYSWRLCSRKSGINFFTAFHVQVV